MDRGSLSSEDIFHPEDILRSEDLRCICAFVYDSGSSFYWGMRFLSFDRRMSIYAVYAFCRLVDDIADNESLSRVERRRRLDIWRGRIASIYDGRGVADGLFFDSREESVYRSLIFAIRHYDLSRSDFMAVIDGMERDVSDVVIAPDLDWLWCYCNEVACAVGRLCVCIFGEGGELGRALAHAQGQALQLTNILRDIHEDSARGRLYLPREFLLRHDIPLDPVLALEHPSLPLAWRALSEIARDYFAQADRVLLDLSPSKIWPARIMLEIYRQHFEHLCRAPDSVIFSCDLSSYGIGTFRQLWIGCRYAFSGLFLRRFLR